VAAATDACWCRVYLRSALSAAGMIGWIGLGLFTYGSGVAMAFLLATNFGLAFGDVIVVSRQPVASLSPACR